MELKPKDYTTEFGGRLVILRPEGFPPSDKYGWCEVITIPLTRECYRVVCSYTASTCRYSFVLKARFAGLSGEYSPWMVMLTKQGLNLYGSYIRPQNSDFGRVEVDTFVADPGHPITSIQVRVDAPPSFPLRTVGVTIYRPLPEIRQPETPAVDLVLDAPEQSQFADCIPEGLQKIVCCPVALYMMLAQERPDIDLLRLIDQVRDVNAKIYCNWSIAAAVAAYHLGGEAYVTSMPGIGHLFREVVAGRTVMVSYNWDNSNFQDVALTGAPMPKSDGHLGLFCGLRDGKVVINDPAGQPGEVRREYNLFEFLHAWRRSGNTAIVYRKS